MNTKAPTLRTFEPSSSQSLKSGGTAQILPNERKKATFNVEKMIHILNGGEDNTKRRKIIENTATKDTHMKYNKTKPECQKEHVKEFIEIHKKFPNFKPTRMDVANMASAGVFYGGLNNSHSIFMLTIIGQGNPRQQQFWIPKILNFEITGSYAQTELGI